MKETLFERQLLNRVKKLEKKIKYKNNIITTWPYKSNGELMDNVSMSATYDMGDS